MSDDAVPETPEDAERLLVEDHVAEIMFETHDVDPECLLCKRGVELGVWAAYGVEDPFAPPETGE